MCFTYDRFSRDIDNDGDDVDDNGDGDDLEEKISVGSYKTKFDADVSMSPAVIRL